MVADYEVVLVKNEDDMEGAVMIVKVQFDKHVKLKNEIKPLKKRGAQLYRRGIKH